MITENTNTQGICNVLKSNNIDFFIERFFNNFSGTRVVFSKSDRAKVQALVARDGHSILKRLDNKGSLCFELYG